MIIICGFGHVGYRSFQLLDRLGKDLSIVSRAINPDWKREAETRGVKVIEGDAKDNRLLIEAGIESAEAILVVTDDDLANLSISLDAKRMNPHIHVITRMFDQDM